MNISPMIIGKKSYEYDVLRFNGISDDDVYNRMIEDARILNVDFSEYSAEILRLRVLRTYCYHCRHFNNCRRDEETMKRTDIAIPAPEDCQLKLSNS